MSAAKPDFAVLQLEFAYQHAMEAETACTPPEAGGDVGGCMVAHAANGGECIEPETIEDTFLVPDHVALAHRQRIAAAGNEKRKGRKPTHASPAARKAAYRAEKARVDYTDKPEIVAKLRETAEALDCSVNELLQSMVRFAECNRNWKQVGLYGARRDGVLQ